MSYLSIIPDPMQVAKDMMTVCTDLTAYLSKHELCVQQTFQCR